MFGEAILQFYDHLKLPEGLPEGVEALYPFHNPETRSVIERFLSQYYHDQRKRILMLGINPGRFGAGLTGIGFTDPLRLETVCGIENSFDKKPELSSRFIYEMIEAYGGPATFYAQFFISAVSPIGFVKDNRNYNYYDEPDLERLIEPFAVDCLKKQIALGCSSRVAVCVGQGKNLKFLERINARHAFFEEIKVVPHPRWIMQYRLKKKDIYLQEYLDTLKELIP